MSVPHLCPKCGDIIGEESQMRTFGRLFFGRRQGNPFDDLEYISCLGQGKHKPPIRQETTIFFGLIRDVYIHYPETETWSRYGEYVGPPRRFLLWFALRFGTRRHLYGGHNVGLLVNGRWVWWNFETGFFGDGMEEFEKLRVGTT